MALEEGVEGLPGLTKGGEGAGGDELTEAVVVVVVDFFVEPEAVGIFEAVGMGGGVEVF